MDLFYFVLFVSTLIFVHEFGHFAFAKGFGVKVLTFSLGFGPKLIRIRGKETDYCLGLFPFGGFVKLLEEGKAREAIRPEDRQRTFEAQALWKRVLIVLAGPAMNLVFPMALYTSVYLEDVTFLPPQVGTVSPGKPADGKLLPGDTIVSIDGMHVASFPDVQKAFASRAGISTRVTVEREHASLDVFVTPVEETEVIEPSELGLFDHMGRIGISPTFLAPVIGVPRTDSPAYRAGLRTFDRVTSINGRPVETFLELARILSQNRGDNVTLAYMRPVSAPRSLGGLGDLAVLETGLASLSPRGAFDRDREVLPAATGASTRASDPDAQAKDMLERSGIESSEMYAAFVPEGSSEWQAGLRAGDRITHLDGVAPRAWKVERRSGISQGDVSMVGQILRAPERLHTLAWTRGGEPMSGKFQVRQERWNDELGQAYERYVFRTTHWLPRAPAKPVPNPHVVTYAIARGALETRNAMTFIAVGFVRLLQGRVSLSAVSGPITLYDVAGDAGAKGTTYFIWAMAVTSVNLGLINLLPIPVLDGGYLLLFLIEWVRRKPVSLRVREVSSLIGMSVLVLLMLIAFKNDVTRKWQTLALQVREITK